MYGQRGARVQLRELRLQVFSTSTDGFYAGNDGFYAENHDLQAPRLAPTRAAYRTARCQFLHKMQILQ